MQPETAVQRTIAGKALLTALAKLEGAPQPVLPWDKLDQEERERWCAAGEDLLTEIGLTALAEDVMGEQKAMKAGIVEVGAEKFMRDAKGNLIALGLIKPQRLLEDEMVRKVMHFARELSDQVRRFKGHTFADLAAFQSLLEQQYGAKAGGAKGNVTFTTFDDTMKVEMKIADQIAFGPELQAAKKLVDECLKEWGADSHEALRALVTNVFSVEKEGQINRGELFSLLAMEIADERWQRAMEAIRDSIRVIGTKAYLRFRIRDEDGAWSTVTIDLAAA
ncbi:DUF3164 family protein [Bosea minatitlanensis]|uniref:DUF3164 family protein n=1 Tax=Bosea minatitlanensis TaxID=128782 RepID=A0ABW0EYS2_9HYPH|nr:DUF3164 family protein [Bosea minatitlanensis]MCT4491774.1 DUF3164 family protein [Bosea minatitlanensis]